MDILRAIPHRPPFLFVDKVVAMEENKIQAQKDLGPELDFFRGHYPHFPIMPGVLTLESIFQAGAILLSGRVGEKGLGNVPALTRIRDAKFKNMVRPGDRLTLDVELVDQVGPAFYMKGKATVDGKPVAHVQFTCALVNLEEGMK
ncbi:MAG: 3-hydroxyacyl-ACP dehydratase FabZ [Nitrospinota bacterium]|nr:3-hydroxyacyl-ACP dehydratase FabZ [Nitrospinota bacterium]MDH5678257.1 3-hydroxyacyl-ACP dehydratase FabZ [Nitrospinota bacterium]MDH5755338.1 3-hydroxyacyl-ACP dehydratase FabZ [Nitrospinota bacterium]